MASDVVLQQRRSAHTQAAISHEQSAEFHRAVAEYFENVRDDMHAARARHHAEEHCQRAWRERDLARCAMGGICA